MEGKIYDGVSRTKILIRVRLRLSLGAHPLSTMYCASTSRTYLPQPLGLAAAVARLDGSLVPGRDPCSGSTSYLSVVCICTVQLSGYVHWQYTLNHMQWWSSGHSSLRLRCQG